MFARRLRGRVFEAGRLDFTRCDYHRRRVQSLVITCFPHVLASGCRLCGVLALKKNERTYRLRDGSSEGVTIACKRGQQRRVIVCRSTTGEDVFSVEHEIGRGIYGSWEMGPEWYENGNEQCKQTWCYCGFRWRCYVFACLQRGMCVKSFKIRSHFVCFVFASNFICLALLFNQNWSFCLILI